MSLIKHYQILEDELKSKPFEEGALYVTTDTNRIFTDFAGGGSHTLISASPIILSTEIERENLLAPINDKLYFVLQTSKLYLYNAGNWYTLTYTHPSYTSHQSGLYKISVDGTGHVNGATAVSKSDITALGIPDKDTTYGVVSTSADGLAPKRDGSISKYLRGDGTWAVPPDTKVTVDSSLSSNSTNPVQNKVVKLAIDTLGSVDIDLGDGSNVAEPNSINADTLGGYAADEYIRKDELGNISPNLGIELNYSVVGSLTAPEEPTQNMIWIQTVTPIGRVFFGNSEPSETFADGDIWICTSDSSGVAFNSLKIGNNYVDMVYPISVKQYINNLWENKTAMIYQNNEWVDWEMTLFKNGSFINGSFGHVLGNSNSHVIIDDGKIVIRGDAATTTRFWSTEKFDFTGRGELVFVVTYLHNTRPDDQPGSSPLGGTWHLGISQTQNDNSFVSEISFSSKNDNNTEEYKVQLPPDGGSYYIKIALIRDTYWSDFMHVSEIKMR